MAGSIWQPAPLTNYVYIIPAVVVAGATATENSPFSSQAVAVTIASTHHAYPWMDGQATLASVACYVVRQFTYRRTVNRPTTNRARCRATALIKTNALPLHQSAIRNTLSRRQQVWHMSLYTPCFMKKTTRYLIAHNFGKCWPVFNFFHYVAQQLLFNELITKDSVTP